MKILKNITGISLKNNNKHVIIVTNAKRNKKIVLFDYNKYSKIICQKNIITCFIIQRLG